MDFVQHTTQEHLCYEFYNHPHLPTGNPNIHTVYGIQ